MNSIPDGFPQKRCSRCEQVLPVSAFTVDRSGKDGFRTICKTCKKVPLLPVPEGSKRCKQCKEVKPATTDHFTPDKACTYGVKSTCRVCTKALVLQKFHLNGGSPPFKWCPGCQQEKPSTSFSPCSTKHDGLASRCKECIRDIKHSDPAKMEEARKYGRKYYRSHEEQCRENGRMYYRSHREACILRSKARRGREKAAPGTLTAAQVQHKLKAQGYRCYYVACGHAKFKKKNGQYIFHLEHTIPLSRTEADPRNDINYVVLACPACNMAKHTRLPHEWPAGGRLF